MILIIDSFHFSGASVSGVRSFMSAVNCFASVKCRVVYSSSGIPSGPGALFWGAFFIACLTSCSVMGEESCCFCSVVNVLPSFLIAWYNSCWAIEFVSLSLNKSV